MTGQRPEGPGVGDLRRAARRSRSRSTSPPPRPRSGCDGLDGPGRRSWRAVARAGARDQREPRARASTRSAWPWRLYDDVVVRVTDEPGSPSTSPVRATETCRATSGTGRQGDAGGVRRLGGAAARARAVRAPTAIPHGRGLGSSAAAIVAGVAGRPCPGRRRRGRLPTPSVLAARRRLEGHPDNVAACLLGRADRRLAAGGDERRPRACSGSMCSRCARRGLRGADRHCRPRRPVGCCPTSVPHADAARQRGAAPRCSSRRSTATRPCCCRRYRGPAAPAVPGGGDAATLTLLVERCARPGCRRSCPGRARRVLALGLRMASLDGRGGFDRAGNGSLACNRLRSTGRVPPSSPRTGDRPEAARQGRSTTGLSLA